MIIPRKRKILNFSHGVTQVISPWSLVGKKRATVFTVAPTSPYTPTISEDRLTTQKGLPPCRCVTTRQELLFKGLASLVIPVVRDGELTPGPPPLKFVPSR